MFERAGRVDVVVIGAGHSGLAVSHCLAARSIEHVVLERGGVANSWRRERWDSLRLLTPNWLSRLPGYAWTGPDPDGYMSVHEVVSFIAGYASVIRAPVLTGTTVTRVEPLPGGGFLVVTDRGPWRCRALVVASGAANLPVVPAVSAGIPRRIRQLTAHEYRNPGQLEPGGVLVVGASATGVQLADEIRRAGHEVMLAVGEHVRLPRVYRGRDIQWWMHAAGILDDRYDQVDDLQRVRRLPSPQLVGARERVLMDLNALSDRGVRLVGRLAGVRDGRLLFSGSLANVCALADLKMQRLLATLDEWAKRNGFGGEGERFPATRVPRPQLELDLGGGAIRTILWATGYRPDYAWLAVPVLDRKGMIRHDGGIADWPGLYVTGLPFLRRRKSSFIHGAGDDAHDIAAHLAHYLSGVARTAAARKAG
ncbi:MAG TPA: NAD(P)-binding domain-containing protein [Woeseiaceae bacterium]|nr:NAD(P)-binding domain-containing protein [Woeseiaceae bacterium]